MVTQTTYIRNPDGTISSQTNEVPSQPANSNNVFSVTPQELKSAAEKGGGVLSTIGQTYDIKPTSEAVQNAQEKEFSKAVGEPVKLDGPVSTLKGEGLRFIGKSGTEYIYNPVEGTATAVQQPQNTPDNQAQREFELHSHSMQQNPFNPGQTIETRNTNPLGLVFEGTRPIAYEAYAKASPIEKSLLNLATLRVKGYEYISESILGGTAASERLTVNYMTESLMTRNPYFNTNLIHIDIPFTNGIDTSFLGKNEIKIGGLTFNDWSIGKGFESLSKTETGIAGTTLGIFTVAGIGANVALSKWPAALAAANRVASVAATYSVETKIIGAAALGTIEAVKINSIGIENQSKVISEVMKDATSFAFATEGFRIGFSEGTGRGTFFRGKIEDPITTRVTSEVLSGKQTYSSLPKGSTAADLKAAFENSPYRLDMNIVSGWHTTAGSNFKFPTVTIPGSSEFPGMFIAPDVNLAYLRLAAGASSSAGRVSLPLNPVALSVKPSSIDIVDISLKNIGTPDVLDKSFLWQNVGSPKAFIFKNDPKIINMAIGKGESQAIIPPGAILEGASTASGGFTNFFTYKNIRIPEIPVTVKAAEWSSIHLPPSAPAVNIMKSIDVFESSARSSIPSVSSIVRSITSNMSLVTSSGSSSSRTSVVSSAVVSSGIKSSSMSVSIPSLTSSTRPSAPSASVSSAVSSANISSGITASSIHVSSITSTPPFLVPSTRMTTRTSENLPYMSGIKKTSEPYTFKISRKNQKLTKLILPTASLYSLEKSSMQGLARGAAVSRIYRNIARSAGLSQDFPAAEFLKGRLKI